MNRVLAIARNTFREAARNKVLYSLLFFAILLIVSALALGQLTLNEEIRMTRDLGLFGIDLFGVVIAVFVGVNLLYKELELKTVYTILPKPIARWEFVLGKFLGMLGTMAIQVVVMALVLALVLFIQGGTLEMALVAAVALIFVNIVVVTAVAMLFSAFSSPFLSGLFAFGIFVLGRSIPDIEQLVKRSEPAVQMMVKGMALLLPNLHLFYPAGALSSATAGGVSTSPLLQGGYVLWVTAYGLGYSAVVLLVAMLIFRKRDFV